MSTTIMNRPNCSVITYIMENLLGRFTYICLVVFFIHFHSVLSSDDEVRLIRDLFRNYNKLIRPVKNRTDHLNVQFGLSLIQLININEREQIMKTNVWLQLKWKDYQLAWNSDDYGGIKMIRIPYSMVWTPDIVLLNNADGKYEVSTKCNIVLSNDGEILWVPPSIYKSGCIIDVKYFPFDEQRCTMRFGSWTYNGNEVGWSFFDGKDYVDLTDYSISGTWDIINVPGYLKIDNRTTPTVSDVTFYLFIRRKTLFYTVNLVAPCIMMSFLSILVFYLPPDGNEKITLGISILLAIVFFQLVISKLLPPTSLTIPLIAKYLLFTFVMNLICVLLTVITVNWNNRGATTHKLPRWLRIIFIDVMPRFVFMRRPAMLRPSKTGVYSFDSSSPSSAYISTKNPAASPIFAAFKGTKKHSGSFKPHHQSSKMQGGMKTKRRIAVLESTGVSFDDSGCVIASANDSSGIMTTSSTMNGKSRRRSRGDSNNKSPWLVSNENKTQQQLRDNNFNEYQLRQPVHLGISTAHSTFQNNRHAADHNFICPNPLVDGALSFGSSKINLRKSAAKNFLPKSSSREPSLELSDFHRNISNYRFAAVSQSGIGESTSNYSEPNGCHHHDTFKKHFLTAKDLKEIEEMAINDPQNRDETQKNYYNYQLSKSNITDERFPTVLGRETKCKEDEKKTRLPIPFDKGNYYEVQQNKLGRRGDTAIKRQMSFDMEGSSASSPPPSISEAEFILESTKQQTTLPTQQNFRRNHRYSENLQIRDRYGVANKNLNNSNDDEDVNTGSTAVTRNNHESVKYHQAYRFERSSVDEIGSTRHLSKDINPPLAHDSSQSSRYFHFDQSIPSNLTQSTTSFSNECSRGRKPDNPSSPSPKKLNLGVLNRSLNVLNDAFALGRGRKSPRSNSSKTEKNIYTKGDSKINRKIPPQVINSVAKDVIFIAKHLKAEDENNMEKEDWKYIAIVVDRILLFIFILVSVGGTIGIILDAPHIFEYVNQQERLAYLTGKKTT